MLGQYLGPRPRIRPLNIGDLSKPLRNISWTASFVYAIWQGNCSLKSTRLFKKEKCEVLSINHCIENIIKKHGKIDIIKIDNEGEELKTVSSINKEFWNIINCLNVDGDAVKKLVPETFQYSKVGSAQRFLKKWKTIKQL